MSQHLSMKNGVGILNNMLSIVKMGLCRGRHDAYNLANATNTAPVPARPRRKRNGTAAPVSAVKNAETAPSVHKAIQIMADTAMWASMNQRRTPRFFCLKKVC